MKERLPAHIIRTYGSAREFKANKRRILTRMNTYTNAFFEGSVCIPDEAKPVLRELRKNLAKLRRLCSAKNWGR